MKSAGDSFCAETGRITWLLFIFLRDRSCTCVEHGLEEQTADRSLVVRDEVAGP